VSESRFKRRGPRPIRLFTYLMAGVLVLGVGGLAAEHGGPNFNGALVAGKTKPAPPAPKPSHNNQTPNNNASTNQQTSSAEQGSSTTDPPVSTSKQCTTHSNKDGSDTHSKCTQADGNATGNQSCPAYGAPSSKDNQVKCQKDDHPKPGQCWWSTTDTHTHTDKNGNTVTTTKTEWKVSNDKDKSGHNDQNKEHCEASGS